MTEAIFDGKSDNVSTIMAVFIYCFSNYIFPRRYVELPEDLWIEIFIRLPVKSLLQGMCVCKHWYHLIKDPSFRFRHLQFQKMVSKNSGHLLLLHHHHMDQVINHFLFDGESITNAMSSSLPLLSYRNLLKLSLGEFFCKFDICGPINGLYCLHNVEGHIVIWNPATNEVGFLPLPEQCIPADDDPDKYLCGSVVGFGTDPLDEEDYKVILFSYCLSAWTGDEFICVMLYTTKTNSWSRFNDDLMVVPSLNNTYLNGFYYWMEECKCTTIVFDMSEKETFQKISTPCHGDLALHNDRITLFSVNNNLNEVDIWVMLEDRSNWLKKISVKGIQEPVVKTLGFWKTENELLLVIDDSNSNQDTQTVLYNTTTREIKNLGPRGHYDGFKASVYYESFVSLSGGITKYKGNDSVSFLDMTWDFLIEESPTF